MRRAIAVVGRHRHDMFGVTGGTVAEVSGSWRPARRGGRRADGRANADGRRMGSLICRATGSSVRGEGAFAAPELRGLIRNQAAAPQPPAPPADPNSPPIGAFWEIGANVPGGLPLTPWAEELKKQRMAVNDKENPDANCLPMGLTQFHMHGQPRKVMQNSGVIAIMYEANYGLRYIYIDGRTLPAAGRACSRSGTGTQ